MSFNPSNYIYHHTEVSDEPSSKYKAVLKLRTDTPDNTTPEQYVYFGDVTKDHVKDKTGLNAYPSKNKGKGVDKKKFKDDYIKEASKIVDKSKDLKYSKIWFEKHLLY